MVESRDLKQVSRVKMYTQETIGHVEGMLNRDLRTTKTLCISARTQNQCHRGTALAECRGVGVSHVFPRKNKRFQQRRNSYAWNSLQRFKHILIVCVYLLSIINLPRSLSKSIGTMEEWWIYSDDKGSNNSPSKCNFVKLMCDQANIARHHGTSSQTKYLMEGTDSFNLDEFFPKVNATNEDSDERDGAPFKAMDLNEFVVKIYNYLQKYAVGLDTMYRHQLAKSDPLVDETGNLTKHLKSLLFEIYDYISAFDITPEPDVHRGDLPDKYQSDMDSTKFTLFSSLLIREYVKTLEYVRSGLNYFNQTECK